MGRMNVVAHQVPVVSRFQHRFDSVDPLLSAFLDDSLRKPPLMVVLNTTLPISTHLIYEYS